MLKEALKEENCPIPDQYCDALNKRIDKFVIDAGSLFKDYRAIESYCIDVARRGKLVKSGEVGVGFTDDQMCDASFIPEWRKIVEEHLKIDGEIKNCDPQSIFTEKMDYRGIDKRDYERSEVTDVESLIVYLRDVVGHRFREIIDCSTTYFDMVLGEEEYDKVREDKKGEEE